MTDATAGRGGVGIRLFVTGGEVVRRTFDQIGDSGRKMWAQIALGERAANPAIRALSTISLGVKDKMTGLASEAGLAGDALMKFGSTGVFLAAALGGLAVALTKTREAMQFAADLTDAADRIGVGVEELQAWGYVADEAGVATETFRANLEKVNGVLGAFKLGIGDAKLKPIFEELGITQEQLNGVQTANQFMMVLADTLGQVRDRAAQVRLARGLGVEESLPILRLGSDAIRELSGDAEKLGLVMGDDVVGALDAADRKLEVAEQRISMSMRLAVSGLADDFASLVGAIASAVAWLERMNRVKISNPGSDAGVWINERVRRVLGMGSNRGTIGRIEGNQDVGEDIDHASLVAGLHDIASGPNLPGGFDLRGHASRTGSNRSGQNAARDAEQRRQRERQVQDANRRLDLEISRALTDDRGTFSISENTANKIAEIQRDLEERLTDIKRQAEDYAASGGLKGLAEAEAQQLRDKQRSLAASKEEAELAQEWRDLAAERLKTEQASAQSAVDLMQIDAQLARTYGERSRIEREILLSTIAIARQRKEAEVAADANLDADGKRNALAEFDRGAQGQIRLFDGQEVSRQREIFRDYGREFTDAIRDGELGDYFGSLADRFVDTLLDSALNGLFDGLFSSGGRGGGGSWLSNIGSWAASLFRPGGGRASGGDARDGFVYRMAEHGPELALFGANGQVVNHADTVRMIQGLAAGGAAASGARGGDVIVDVTYAPNIRVDGSGPEVEALRRELAAERAQFRANVVSAVREAKQRREV